MIPNHRQILRLMQLREAFTAEADAANVDLCERLPSLHRFCDLFNACAEGLIEAANHRAPSARRLATLEHLAGATARRRPFWNTPETEEQHTDALATDLEISCLLGELGITGHDAGRYPPLVWIEKAEYHRLKALDRTTDPA